MQLMPDPLDGAKEVSVFKLVIGNRNYSSWSLRAWLFLRESGIPFEEHRIPMFSATWAADVAAFSPAHRVPVLIDGSLRVWDSLAIIEHVRERHPAAIGWPEEAEARAEARSIVSEMHSGFMAVRGELPQNIRLRSARSLSDLSPSCKEQIARISEIWESLRTRYEDRGPWLFGEFSLADIMFAPVALRFITYSISLPSAAQQFVDAIEELKSVQEWCEAAKSESETIEFIDQLVPADGSPLTLG